MESSLFDQAIIYYSYANSVASITVIDESDGDDEDNEDSDPDYLPGTVDSRKQGNQRGR